ncbi:hypothetical protein N3K66_008092 [Trichothecium roseum]|uniref:Uncharacterized protein n=1 Tax=Trichothecium roseum TaxID=47278 RepID=A0ACC0USM3_9HYPO|nr:hypothetical protein N3K66_008092 [Trichothecium roseum]
MESYYSHDQLQPQMPRGQGQQQHSPQDKMPPSSVGLGDPGATTAAHQQMGQLASDQPMMGTVDSLDEIIANNQNTLHRRRRSMPQSYPNAMHQDQNQRRMSSIGTNDMIDFGNGGDNMGSFHFDQAMPTGFPALNTNDLNMGGGMDFGGGQDFSVIPSDMMGSMIPSTFANMNMNQMGSKAQHMNMFSPTGNGHMGDQYDPNQLGSMGNEFSMDMNADDGPLGTTSNNPAAGMPNMDGLDDDMMNVGQGFPGMDPGQAHQAINMALDRSNIGTYNAQVPSLSRHVSSPSSVVSPQRGASSMTQPSASSNATTPVSGPTPREPKEKMIYSKSGFDMLKALWLVATRKDPKINLGAVDMSCAFVVCDVSLNDCPIVYVSDNFQNLTGYNRHEITGQNCRFLQAPDGKVEAGSRREFVDDGAVYNLKKMIHEGREVQQSLINYRKGGKPFLNLLTMIPIPWDTDEIRYFIGFQIDLVECPDAIASGQEMGGVKVNYKHSDIGQYIWTPPPSSQWEPDNGQTLGVDDVSTLLQRFTPSGLVSDWHKQSWDKMLLENTDDVVHVLSLKGLFLYLSPSCRRVLEYDAADLVGNSLSTVCHPSDIVPVTRELKDATAGNPVNIVFRIRRKNSGYTWFESHGALFNEQGKGRKCIILVGRKRPVFALSRRNLESNGGIGDSELWSKLSTSGMFLFVSSNIRSLLDLQPESLVGTSIQDLMRKESKPDFGRAVERARRGKIVTCKHEVQNRRGQVLQAQTVLYPGDASDGQKPSFLLAQTKLIKASSRSIAPASGTGSVHSSSAVPMPDSSVSAPVSQPAGGALKPGSQDAALASDDNIFDELRTTKCSSWQYELRQMEKVNRILAEELGGLLSKKKKRKRRKGVGNVVRDCANCHTRNTPEWRRGPSGERDLCNSCGLRWAKQTGRVSPRNSSRGGNGDTNSKKSASPIHSSPLHRSELNGSGQSTQPTQTANPPAPTPSVDGDGGAINPSKLTNNTQPPQNSGSKPATTITMPPPSQPLLSTAGSAMTSIREERETSQP